MPHVGLNVDPLDINCPHPDVLHTLGVTSVRLLMVDDTAVKSFIDTAKDGGLTVMGMLDSSRTLLPGVDWLELAARPDQSDDDYVTDWQQIRGLDPRPLLAGIQTRFGPQWWGQLAPRLTGITAAGLILTDLSIGQAQARWDALRNAAPAVPLYVSEWWRPLASIRSFGAMLRQRGTSYWAPWSDTQRGLLDRELQPRPALSEFRHFATAGGPTRALV